MNWSHTDLSPFQSQLNIVADKPALLFLQQFSSLTVTGQDAAEFLHNLLSNDVKSLNTGESRLCGFCNPKGRLLAILIITKHDDAYTLILPSDLLETIKARLTMFVLRSQVTIESAVQSGVVALVKAHSALFEMTPSFNAFPVPSMVGVELATVETQHVNTLIEVAQSQNYQIASDNAWRCLLIESGLAQVFAESREAFTPQQVNLELVNGVSFSKGCYPGQEVVARLHYLGKPSRRLFKGQINAQQLPAINSDVLDADGQVLGQVVMSAYLNDDTVLVQLSMKLADIDKAALIDGVICRKSTTLCR